MPSPLPFPLPSSVRTFPEEKKNDGGTETPEMPDRNKTMSKMATASRLASGGGRGREGKGSALQFPFKRNRGKVLELKGIESRRQRVRDSNSNGEVGRTETIIAEANPPVVNISSEGVKMSDGGKMSDGEKMSEGENYPYTYYTETDNTCRNLSECRISEEEEKASLVTEEENEWICRAFQLLDTDGDGVVEYPEFEFLLQSLGRLSFDENLADLLTYSGAQGCENATGMDFNGFKTYVGKQICDARDEEELRKAFQVFDSSPPTGKVNVKELRHWLKTKGICLTDDEIDFLYREEDYWMLDEKDTIQYEKLIAKLMDKPFCDSKFLHNS